MEVICINDVFEARQKAIIPNRPVEGKIYTIRDVFHLPNGKTGVWLHELHNPLRPHPSGLGMYEPSFDSKRFTTLLNAPVEVQETIYQYETDSN